MSSALWTGPLAEEQRRLHLRAAAEYEDLYRLYLKGRLDELEFRARRNDYGVQGLASPGRMLLRLKTPLGRLSAQHLRLIADLARRYTPRQSVRISPRQNLHYYGVALEDTPGFLREAAEGGFGVVGVGGRHPCNLTLPAGAGLGPEEAFDPSWVAALMRLRLEEDADLRGLPGPLKMGFWRSLHDEESLPGNDLTVVPVRRLVGTRLRRGFRLLLGASLWKSFVLPQDLYAHLRAVILHFKAAGGSRLSGLLLREGWPQFQRAVESLLELQPRDRTALFFHHLPLSVAPPGVLLKLRLGKGRLSAPQAEALAAAVQGGQLRLSPRQELWLPGLPLEAGPELKALRKAWGPAGKD